MRCFGSFFCILFAIGCGGTVVTPAPSVPVFSDVKIEQFGLDGETYSLESSLTIQADTPFQMTATGVKPAEFVLDSCIVKLRDKNGTVMQSTSDVKVELLSKQSFKLVINMAAVTVTGSDCTIQVICPRGKIGEIACEVSESNK